MSTAISPSRRARGLGVELLYKNLGAGQALKLPMRVAIVGQGASASTYSTDPAQVFSSFDVGNTYGFGSPLHLASLQVLPLNGDGVGIVPVTVYPLEDAVAAATSAGDITPVIGVPSENGNYTVAVNNIESQAFTVETADTVADIIDKMVIAVNATPEIPVIAADGTTTLDLTAKWGGASANDLYVTVNGPTGIGYTWTITQPTGGATNPDVTDALSQFGDVWETLVINCLEPADTTALAAYSSTNEGRWAALRRREYVAFTGDTNETVAGAIAIPDARPTDRTNVQITVPTSVDLPLVIAARAVARIAVLANADPAYDYGYQRLTGLTQPLDKYQWNGSQRDTAMKAGCSTVEFIDSVVNISDVVTFYHPTGNPLPEYSHVVDIIRLMNIHYNAELIMLDPAVDSAPLIPDEQDTTNPNAIKPRNIKARFADMIDSLALEAIISDPATAKKTIVVTIDTVNPKRVNVTFVIQLSGNANVKSVTVNWGFYFGAAQVAA